MGSSNSWGSEHADALKMEDTYFVNTVLTQYYGCVNKFILNKIIYIFSFICNNITSKILWHT
jgi:putative flippase GtrA